MRSGLDVARDGTFTLASLAARGLLLIEPTVVPQRNGGVTGSVKGGAKSGSANRPEAHGQGARISFVITVCGLRSPVRAAVAGPRGSLPSRPRPRSLRLASPRYRPPRRRRRWLLRVLRAARTAPLSPPISARAHPAGRSPAPGCLLLAGAPAHPLSGRPIRRAPRASASGPDETAGSLPPARRIASYPHGPAPPRHPVARPRSRDTGRSRATSGAPVLHPVSRPSPARNGAPLPSRRPGLDSRRAC